MATVNITQVRKDIYSLMDSVLENGALTITSKKGNAVLISEEDWNAVKETLYLLSVPDMLESLEEAESMDISECATWDSLKDTL
ncbi:MAG: type II toxin-antitoxin system Phd/YefM family antitoxin [Methanomassiliicoccaceae archaeon]|jgi:PHD/YefM family antitoxin component YafN of YafNO toxin-antitoxin module|nr:type II toxin-antitoxin system Phd/YefM family antitoxin [Methanomassiliicoccaceae archaeon]